MRSSRLLKAFGVATALLALVLPATAFAYTGSLLSTSGGILGTGAWITPGPTYLDWTVTQNSDSSWHYSYTFGHPAGATSHFILEVSESFTRDDIFNMGGDFSGIEIKEHATGDQPNPGMPESIYGIKFDDASGNITNIYFDSFRVPVWQDFYAKSGVAGGAGINAAWNAGFLADNPTAPADDGSVGFHILAPDTYTTVPEPSTLLLLGSGLLGSVAIFRRRR